jgi:alpha-galactosidase
MAVPQKNKLIQISTNQDGTWNVERPGGVYPTWMGVQPSIEIHRGFRTRQWSPSGTAVFSKGENVRVAGKIRKTFLIEWPGSVEPISIFMEFALDAQLPICFLRMGTKNSGTTPCQLERISLFAAGEKGRMRLHPSQRNVAMFIQGWQSWSFTGTVRAKDWMPGVKLGPVNDPMHYAGGRRPGFGRGKFRSEMFSILTEEDQGTCAVMGFLSQREHFGYINVELDSNGPRKVRMECAADGILLEPGEEVMTDWVCLIPASTSEPAFDWYLDAAAQECGARVPESTPAGWCSWYQYHDKVTENDIQANLQAATSGKDEMPLELILQDDGYQANVGDWLERKATFLSPMKKLASSIRQKGFSPGLWIAPFVAKPDSKLVCEHPDWLLKAKYTGYASAGFLWMRWTRVLDVTHPEAMAYIENVIRTVVKEWGFRYLKLDFLYAAAVAGQRHHPKMTRAQILHMALGRIRKAAGRDVFLIGCGCPSGSGIGIFDAMRIGPDVDQRWWPHVFGQQWLARHDPTVPSAFNSVRNILTRAPLHRRWWWNDPDCLLARDTDSFLTLPERQTLATAISLTGGLMILSDSLPALSPASRNLVQCMLPPLTARASILDAGSNQFPDLVIQQLLGPLGNWQLMGVFNWTGKSTKRDVELSAYGISTACEVFSFWDQKVLSIDGGQLNLILPAHGCVLLGIHGKREGVSLVGSSLHVSQGSEISAWDVRKTGISIGVDLARNYSGKMILRLPKKPKKTLWNRKSYVPEPCGDGLFVFHIAGYGKGKLEVQW